MHDICSAVHPHPLASPFLRELPLAEHGLELVQPELPLAHPLDGGEAVVLARSIDATAASIGGADGDAYRALLEPLVRDAEKLFPAILGPLRPTRHPIALSRFGLRGLRSAKGLARRFDGPRGRALVAGNAAHSMLRIDRPPTSAVALVLMLTGHHVGWPVARGGSQAVADALASILRSLGGEIETGRRVESLDELGDAGAVLLDLTPQQVLALAGHRLPGALPARPRALPLRPRRLQARLGARRPDPVDGAGVRARGHGARRRHVRGDRRLREPPPHARPPQRAAVRPASPSPRSATPAARRRASTRAGPTATSRPARRAT